MCLQATGNLIHLLYRCDEVRKKKQLSKPKTPKGNAFLIILLVTQEHYRRQNKDARNKDFDSFFLLQKIGLANLPSYK